MIEDSSNFNTSLAFGAEPITKTYQPLIIALSALVDESIFAKCIQSGFDDVSKSILFLPFLFAVESPLKASQIQEKILNVLARCAAEELDDLSASDGGGANCSQTRNVISSPTTPPSVTPKAKFGNGEGDHGG
jgi:CheY-like chemotaxis protein